MTRTSTPRAVGAALALVIGSAAGLSAQTTPSTTPSTTGTPSSTAPDSARGGIPGGTTGSATGTVGGAPLGGTAQPTTTDSANGTLSRPVQGSSNGMSGSGMTNSMSGSSSSMSGSTGMSGMQTQPPTRRRRTSGSAAGTLVRKDASGMGVTKDLAPAPAPEVVTTTTTTTTIPVAPERKLGNGFYFGVQGGANFPQNNIRTNFRTGFNGGIQLGYDPETSPIGLRVNALYNRLRGQDNQSLSTGVQAGDAELYSAFADAVLRLPFGRFLGATSGLYLVGGPGLSLIRNADRFPVATGGSVNNNVGDRNVTRFSVNGGAGLEYGIGSVSLFTEGRYVRVFTQGRDTDYVPVTFGLRFHR